MVILIFLTLVKVDGLSSKTKYLFHPVIIVIIS